MLEIGVRVPREFGGDVSLEKAAFERHGAACVSSLADSARCNGIVGSAGSRSSSGRRESDSEVWHTLRRERSAVLYPAVEWLFLSGIPACCDIQLGAQ